MACDAPVSGWVGAGGECKVGRKWWLTFDSYNELYFVYATFDDVEVDNDNEHGHVNGAPQLVCRSVCQGFEYDS
jgi:hypothetical protein